MRKDNIRKRLEQRIDQLEKELKQAREMLVMKNQGNAMLVAEKAELMSRLEALETATGVRYFKPSTQVEA